MKEKQIDKAIVSWYEKNKRDIPWRENTTPYYIWLSEIMCQQTRIDTVIPYFNRFIREVPDIHSLATIDDDKLMKLWQGLGYYSRAKNLKKAAIKIEEEFEGIFPSDFKDVLSLPGIGTYTAGAILSISMNQNYAAVDGNVLRVFTRLYNDTSDIGLDSTKEKYKVLIESMKSKNQSYLNQGIMDIGATICIPNGKPLCDLCPLNVLCEARIKNTIDKVPVKVKKITKKEEDYTVFVINNKEGKILIHQRNSKGLLANLFEFKNIKGHLSTDEVQTLFKTDKVNKLKDKDFIFTHKIWHMSCYEVILNEYVLEDKEQFVSMDEIDVNYSIPTAFKGIIEGV